MRLTEIITSLIQEERFRRVAAFVFVAFLLLPIVLIVAVALEKPRQALKLAASWKFWLVSLFINAVGSIALSIVFTRFPPDQRLLPGLGAVAIMAGLAAWLNHRTRRRRDRPAA